MKKNIFYIVFIILLSTIVLLWNLLVNPIEKNDNKPVSTIEKQLNDYYNKAIIKTDKEWIVLFYEIKNKENNNEQLFFIDLWTNLTTLDSYIIEKSNKNFKSIDEMNNFYKTVWSIWKKDTNLLYEDREKLLKKVFSEKEVQFILLKTK